MARKTTKSKNMGSIKESTNRLHALGMLFTILDDDVSEAYADASLTAPEMRIRRRFELDILTPGGAVSLLPVESLYKTWINPQCNCKERYALGAMKHLYLGDSALHMRALFKSLEIEVPIEFSAMPDHLALLCELAFIYGEVGNLCALEVFLDEHFNWITTYVEELIERKLTFENSQEPDKRTLECVKAIEHTLMLLNEVDKTLIELRRELRRKTKAA